MPPNQLATWPPALRELDLRLAGFFGDTWALDVLRASPQLSSVTKLRLDE